MISVVLVTIPRNKAKALAKALLEKKVCACVNILPGVESLFWWQGKIDTQKEALLIIKTKSSAFSKLEQAIKSRHPYSVPEIIALKADKISKAYEQWVKREINA